MTDERGPVEAATLRTMRGRGAPTVHTRAHFARAGQRDWRGVTLRPPSQATLDAIAEAQMSGGWNVRRANICDACHLAKTVSGVCGC